MEDAAVLAGYRTSVLRDGATYDIAAVPTLPTLPILTESNRAVHAAWHAYIANLYGNVSFPVDLNTFGFFYWSAPLRLRRILLCDWNSEEPVAPFGTPWTGGTQAWAWGPEHMTRRAGFFVRQPRWDDGVYTGAARLEVMRVGPEVGGFT